MKDHENAAADLAAMIDAAGLGCRAIAGGEGSAWGDGDPLTFPAWISFRADNRDGIRADYVPSAFDVVSALLSDVAAFGGCADWLEAAEKCGCEMDAASLREFRDGFERTRTEVAPFLRRAFGDRFDEAMRLAGEL